MKLPLFTFSEDELDRMTAHLVREQNISDDTLFYLVMIEAEKDKRRKARELNFENAVWAEANEIDGFMPIAGRC